MSHKPSGSKPQSLETISSDENSSAGGLRPEVLAWLADTAEEVIFLVDPKGQILYLNETARAHWVGSNDDGRGKPIVSMLYPQDVGQFVQAWDQVVSENVPEVSISCRFQTATKPEGHFMGIGSLGGHRTASGDLEMIRGKVLDFTDVERVTTELQEEKDLLDTIIKSVGVGLVVVDRNYNLFYQNEGARRRYGTPKKRKCFSQFGLEKRCEGCVLDEILAGKDTACCMLQGLTHQGDELWVEILGAPVTAKNGRMIGVVEVITDITDRKRMESELLQASKLASLGELVSGLAHEINGPLTVIMGNSQLVQRSLAAASEGDPDLNATIGDRIDSILNETVRASTIVKNLLAFARKGKTKKTSIDLNEAIEKTLDLRVHGTTLSGIETRLELDPDLPLIEADFQQVQQVLLNVINNAISAMESARGERILTIRTWCEKGRGKVSVIDTGEGITGENLDKIFDPFFTTKGAGEGTGLGLSICHGIIQQHGGTISATSEPGKGTCFTVELPLGGGDEKESQSEIGMESELLMVSPKSILVVDDEPGVLGLLEEVLSADLHEVVPARDGEEAMKELDRRKFDLILTDIRMPRMGGIRLYEKLREIDPDQAGRVVFITGDLLNPETRAFVEGSGNPFLVKPFDVNKIRQVVYQVTECGQDLPPNP